METYPKSWKNCAVCNYWGGSRQIDTFGKKVTVDSREATGKCLHQGAGRKGQDTQAGSKCTEWEAWAVLE